MSIITKDVEVKQVDAQRWQLLKPVTYCGFGVTITAPAGFITDFASTPQIVWTLGMPKSGIYDPAAIVHDYLYVKAGQLPQTIPGQTTIVPKVTADLIFEDALALLGVGQPKRWLMYQAVKQCGKGNYGPQ
jgi:hypothetical protein